MSANAIWWEINTWFSERDLKTRIALAEDLISTLQSEVSDWERELKEEDEDTNLHDGVLGSR